MHIDKVIEEKQRGERGVHEGIRAEAWLRKAPCIPDEDP